MQRAAGPTDAAAPKLGNPVSLSSMVDVAPAKLADTKIRVLNASGQGGQAGEVAGALRDLGFAQPTAANDPLYAGARRPARARSRFGAARRPSAARPAVWLVAPCVKLYQDDRQDDSVDLAIGTGFTTLAHSDIILPVLAGLRQTPPGNRLFSLAKDPQRHLLTAHNDRSVRTHAHEVRVSLCVRSESTPTVQSSGANPRTGPARRAVAQRSRRGGHQ